MTPKYYVFWDGSLKLEKCFDKGWDLVETTSNLKYLQDDAYIFKEDDWHFHLICLCYACIWLTFYIIIFENFPCFSSNLDWQLTSPLLLPMIHSLSLVFLLMLTWPSWVGTVISLGLSLKAPTVPCGLHI